MNLNLLARHYRLQFRHAFHIAHGNRTFTDTVYTEINDGIYTGYGEAALPPYLGYNPEDIIREVNAFKFTGDSMATILDHLHDSDASRPAKACMDIALHDLWAKQEQKTLHALLNIPFKDETICFYTLGISSVDILEEKLAASAGTKVYKIKLGGENDLQFLREFRKRSDAPFCADANQAWTTANLALEQIENLQELNCLFIEQPMPVGHPDNKILFEKSSLPIYLDESIQGVDDINSLADACDGINVKLVKCGGIRPALQWIRAAEAAGLKLLIGCMSESTCGAAAALQLNSFSEYVDLDGPLLINNDPFSGLNYQEGIISTFVKVGTGANLL